MSFTIGSDRTRSVVFLVEILQAGTHVKSPVAVLDADVIGDSIVRPEDRVMSFAGSGCHEVQRAWHFFWSDLR
jgi:hypothetical protein